jgi:hypothetical protein
MALWQGMEMVLPEVRVGEEDEPGRVDERAVHREGAALLAGRILPVNELTFLARR